MESTVRMGFPPGITSSGTRNPPEEYDSAGNNQHMEADSDRQDQNVRKILKQFQDQQVQILFTAKVNFFYKFKYENVIKMKNKSDPDLSRGS
jgi:hypothetical protein